MRVMVCGAGSIARELLKRLGDSWKVTLVEKDRMRIELATVDYPNVVKVVQEDASSPVVLENAGLAEHDYILALTASDEVNEAIVRFARDAGVDYILALVNKRENVERFTALQARVVRPGELVARHVYQYLQDPRIIVSPLSLGMGEVIELDSSHYFRMVGRLASNIQGDDWKLAAIFRNGEMIIPNGGSVVEAGDKLVIIGTMDSFQPVCSLLECGSPHFPLAYGEGLLLGLLPDNDNTLDVLEEAEHLARNTMVTHLEVVCGEENCEVRDRLEKWDHTFELEVNTQPGEMIARVKSIAREKRVGCVIIPPFESAFWKRFGSSPLVSLAHEVGRPVLVARGTDPYRRILVPFNKHPKAELALEIAIDIARQVGGDVSVVTVVEDDFVHGAEYTVSAEKLFGRVREIAHTHKVKIEEIKLEGNPVTKVTELAKDFGLMVVGSATSSKGFFTPHIGELMAGRAPCSVLIVTG